MKKKTTRILDFREANRTRQIDYYLDDLEVSVREGDFVSLDEVIERLLERMTWAIPRIMARMQKYLVLGDDRFINAYRDVLVQIGRPSLPELRKAAARHPGWMIFPDIIAEIFVSEMIDNYFAWREHHIKEDVYHLYQSGLVDELVRLGTPVVPQLIRNLMNVNIREYIILALGRIGDKRATVILATFLREIQLFSAKQYRSLAKQVVRALGDIGDRRAVRPLVDFLGSDSLVGKEEAARAIEKILGRNFGKFDSFGTNKRSWRTYQRRILDFLASENAGTPHMQLFRGELP